MNSNGRKLLEDLLKRMDFIFVIFVILFKLNYFNLIEKLNFFNFDNKYSLFAWPLALFLICFIFSFFRLLGKVTVLTPSKVWGGAEILILSALIFSIYKYISADSYVLPQWILSEDYLSYFYDVFTTAGAGYAFSHLIFRSAKHFRKG